MFGVKRLTTFGLNFSGMEQYRDKMTEKIAEFNNNFETKPDLNKFRYADDSMFNSSKFGHTLIKKWDVLVNQKNNKKKIRSKSAPKEWKKDSFNILLVIFIYNYELLWINKLRTF